MRAILIDATNREVREVELPEDAESQVDAIRLLLGGWLELAYGFPNSDVLYVDEEGKLKNPARFFQIAGVYSRTRRAKLECEAWLKKRGQWVGDATPTVEDPMTALLEQARLLERCLETFAGNGVITGSDPPETTAAKTQLADLLPLIRWGSR